MAVDAGTQDAYAHPDPEGDAWGYVIDDGFGPSITYGPGPWPFYAEGKPAAWVLVSPDDRETSGANNRVKIVANPLGGATAVVKVMVRKTGCGGALVTADVTITRANSVRVKAREDVSSETLAKLLVKAKKIARFLFAEVAERDRGCEKPFTLSDSVRLRDRAKRLGITE